MYIDEIPEGAAVLLTASGRAGRLEHAGTVLPRIPRQEGAPRRIRITPSGEGREMAIPGMDPEASVALMYATPGSGRAYIWDGASVDTALDPLPHYTVSSDTDAPPSNRRQAVRIPIGLAAPCSVQGEKDGLRCMVKDISLLGIGLSIDIRADGGLRPAGKGIAVSLHDPGTGDSFRIRARCIRAEPAGTGMVRCGCEILEAEPPLNRYLNKKQLHRLARAAGNMPKMRF